MRWLSPTPTLREERHYGARLMRCFAERPASVNAMLGEAVERRPDLEALVCGTTRLTYSVLDRGVGRLSAGLAGLGIVRGDRVALLLAD